MKNVSSKKTIIAALGVAGIVAATYQFKDSFFQEEVPPVSSQADLVEAPFEIEEIKKNDIESATDDSIVDAPEATKVESKKMRIVKASTPKKRMDSPPLYTPPAVTEVEVEKSKLAQRKISSLEAREEWNISLAYGVKLLSITQKVGTIDADLGMVYPSNVQLVSEFVYNDWSTWFQFNTYEFSYETTSSKGKDRMSSAELGLSYKWLMGALGVEQNPLFNMSDEIIGLARQSTTYVAVGAQKDIELSTQKPSSLNLKAWFSLPVATSSSNADVELSNVTGFGVRGQVEFNREIIKRSDYSLHATWSTNVGYQKIEQNLKWGNLDDKVKTTIIGASSTIGLQLKF